MERTDREWITAGARVAEYTMGSIVDRVAFSTVKRLTATQDAAAGRCVACRLLPHRTAAPQRSRRP